MPTLLCIRNNISRWFLHLLKTQFTEKNNKYKIKVCHCAQVINKLKFYESLLYGIGQDHNLIVFIEMKNQENKMFSHENCVF